MDNLRTIINAIKQWVVDVIRKNIQVVEDKIHNLPQSNWNQNDETAEDYIKNRPFYEGDITYTSITSYTATKTSDNTLIFTFPWQDGFDTTGDKSKAFYVNGQFFDVGVGFSDYNGMVDLTITLGDGTKISYDISAYSSCEVELTTLETLINSTYPVKYVKDLGSEIIQIDTKYLPKATDSTAGAVILSELVGRKGSGSNAEIFNDNDNIASGDHSHAEGYDTTASGNISHAEGYDTTAFGDYSHAEGYSTIASGDYSHAEGTGSTASGNYSHAEGQSTTASGDYSHAEGYETTALGAKQHVQGYGNITDNTLAHIVGNGTRITPSNAHTLDWNGNAWYAGDVYVGSTSGTNKDEGSKKLATEEYATEIAKKIVYNYIYLADIENGGIYKLEIKNGTLTTSLDTKRLLQDFTYTVSEDGTHTITGWNETFNSESSTEFVIPETTAINIEI